MIVLQTTLSNAIYAGNLPITLSMEKLEWGQECISTYQGPASAAQCSVSPWR